MAFIQRWFRFQQSRLDFACIVTGISLFALVVQLVLAGMLSASEVVRVSVTLPLLGILVTATLAALLHPWLKKLDLPRRDRNIVLIVCLGVSALPPLMTSFAPIKLAILFWLLCCSGEFPWLLWFMGGRPPLRREVDGQLAHGEGLVKACKTVIEQIERERPTTDSEKAKAAEHERVRKERDERLAVLEEAMRNSDDPLDPVTASAQFQQIQTDYREAVARLSS